MIKLVEENDELFSVFCDRDVFGTRIKAYYNCYGTEYDFVKFWVQLDGETVIGAISRIDGDTTISAVGENIEELKEFLCVVGFSTIQCEKRIADKMNAKSTLNGYVVEYVKKICDYSDIILKSHYELKEIYDIIREVNLADVGDYMPWLSDTTFRINRKATETVISQYSEGCAMVLFRTDKASVLGAVATRPEYRSRGIGGALVTLLAQKEKDNGRRVELLCKNDTIVNFYKSIGFVVKNEWSIIDETGLL